MDLSTEQPASGLIDFNLRCPTCKTDLFGTALDGDCPRCGRPVGRTIRVGLLDAQTQCISGDAECIKCGYNLRTQPARAVCPECATPVVDTLRSAELQFAPREWLARVRLGAMLLAASAAGTLLNFVLAVLWNWGGGMSAWRLVLFPIGLIVMSLWTAGVVLACWPEQMRTDSLRSDRRRLVAMLLAVAVFGWLLLRLLMATFSVMWNDGFFSLTFRGVMDQMSGGFTLARLLGGVASSVAQVVAWVLVLILMARLARRAGRSFLRACLLLLCGVLLLVSSTNVAWIFLARTGPSSAFFYPAMMAFQCADPLRSLLLLIGMVQVSRMLGACLRPRQGV